MVSEIIHSNSIVFAFLLVGIFSIIAKGIARLTKDRIHESAIAIMLGLISAYIGGLLTGGTKGLADIAPFTGLNIMGGTSFRDLAVIATAYEAKPDAIKKCGIVGLGSLLMGVTSAYLTGAFVALCAGFRDAESIATIASGAVTFIVGPVTGSTVGASSSVIALSIAAGLAKSIVIMVITPIVANKIGLTTSRAAIIYGGLMGSVSGTSVGLAATKPELVPYGAMIATFYTGLGCLLCPSIFYSLTKMLF